jgi:hypothetical protein
MTNIQFVSKEPKLKRMRITPEMAERLLETKHKNRSITRSAVNRYKREMLCGMWDEEAPQPIGFDKRGRLVDGQHRMLALLEADMTLQFWCALGMSERTIFKIDGGKHRKLSDRFQAFTNDGSIKRVTDGGKPGRSTKAAAIVSFLFRIYTSERVPSIEDARGIVKHYEDALTWTLDEWGTSVLLRRSAVMTALVLAHTWAKRQKGNVRYATELLEDACLGLDSGEDISGNVLLLRRYLQSLFVNSNDRNRTRADSQWIIFTKTLRALQAILTEEPAMKRIIAPTKPRDLREFFTGSETAIIKKLKLQSLEMLEEGDDNEDE